MAPLSFRSSDYIFLRLLQFYFVVFLRCFLACRTAGICAIFLHRTCLCVWQFYLVLRLHRLCQLANCTGRGGLNCQTLQMLTENWIVLDNLKITTLMWLLLFKTHTANSFFCHQKSKFTAMLRESNFCAYSRILHPILPNIFH